MANPEESGFRLSRRRFLGSTVTASAGLLVGACATPRGAAPEETLPQRTGEPWERDWDALVQAAQREGRIVIGGPPTATTREEVPAAFKRRFGIDVEWLGGRSGDLMIRLQTERAAGQYTVDIMFSGANTTYIQGYPQGMFDPLLPMLIHPEAIDPTKWRGGRIWFMDPEGNTILRVANYISSVVATNEDHARIDEIRSWRDLADPKYRGKISSQDPTVSGSGSNTAVFLARNVGEDFVSRLYREQQTAVSRDERQLADWLLRGTYPISIGLNATEIEPLRQEGFRIGARSGFPDAPGITTAGFGLLVVLNNAPNPNAAKLFANWIAMKEGAETFCRSQVIASTRADVDNSWMPEYSIPQPGLPYFDAYAWDYVHEARSPEQLERMKRITGIGG